MLSDKLKNVEQVNNHPLSMEAKIELRQNVLEHLGAPARVFEAFAGDGSMYRGAWHQAEHYVGCDLEWYRDDRYVFVGDNRRVLRAIPLEPFNVFDLDAYGSPWEQALIVADRRKWKKGERVSLIITDGTGLNMRFGQMPGAVTQLTGIKKFAGVSRKREWIISRCLAAWAGRIGAQPVKRWSAHKKQGASVLYIASIFEIR